MNINQQAVALEVAKRDAQDNTDLDAEYEKALEEVETRKKQCKGLEYAGHATGLVNNLLGDIPGIPLVTDIVKKVVSGIAAVLHVAEFGMDIASTAMRCGAVNFDEIKIIMDKRFNEVDRKLDKMTEVMARVTEVVTLTLKSVEETRAEMDWGFKNVLATLKNREIQSILSKINKFSRYLEEKRNELNKLSAGRFLFRLKEKGGFLDYLKKVRTPEGLHGDLFELMDKNNDFVIPENANDSKAFQALYALFYGTQIYASVMFYLLKQYSYLADYYYQTGLDNEFNYQFDLLITTFKEFKTSLVGRKGLINKVVKTLGEVKNKPFIKDVKNPLYIEISKRQDTLGILKTNISNMALQVIEDLPEPVLDINFDEPVISSNYGDWDDKSKVRYAVQLRKDGTYSKFSEWTEPIKVDGKANPFLKVPRDEMGRDRLIFRKFDDDKPQLTGILTKSQMEFRDIDRDLYNAAKSKDQTKPLEYLPTLINASTYINGVFEMGRTAMHAAAESGNVKIAMRFLLDETQDELLNAGDEKGFTPMHIAANSKNAGFLNFLITHNADVNAQTTTEKLTPLHIASQKGYAISVKNLLSSDKIEINKPEKSGYTPLHYAIRGTAKTIKTLLASDKILVNAKSDFGLTPFHLAVMKGDREICDALLSTGKVDVNDGNKDNMTSLHFAAMAGNTDMVQYLLSEEKYVKEVNVNAVTSNSNWTPLYFAIYFKQEDTALELLKNSKVDISIASKEDHTPLQLSIATGQMKVFDELLKKDSNLDTASEEGLTALHIAALRPKTYFTSKLLDKNANINAIAKDGSTPLHLATKSDKTDQIMLLINRGASLKMYDKKNALALHYSVQNNNLEALKVAIKQDPSIVDFETKEGKALGQYCVDLVFMNVFDYYKNKDSFEYREYKDLPPLEVFKKMGYYDLIRIMVNNSTLEYVVNGTIEAANQVTIVCMEREKDINQTPCDFNMKRSRRKIDTVDYEGYQPAAKLQPFNFVSNYIGTLNDELGMDSLDMKLKSNRNYFPYAKSSFVQNIDTNGTLLLLDLFVRKLTDEKYHDNSKEMKSTLGSQVAALEIIDKVSDFLDDLSDVPAGELIDLAKLHSDLYKSIEGGNSNDLLDLLCEQLKKIVDPEQIASFLFDLTANTSDSAPETQNSIKTAMQRCFPEDNKGSKI